MEEKKLNIAKSIYNALNNENITLEEIELKI